MYQTSLAQFNELYEQAIDRSEKASMPSKRINNIIEYMTYEIYLYIQVGVGWGRGVTRGPNPVTSDITRV
jgi:dynein heavy chain